MAGADINSGIEVGHDSPEKQAVSMASDVLWSCGGEELSIRGIGVVGTSTALDRSNVVVRLHVNGNSGTGLSEEEWHTLSKIFGEIAAQDIRAGESLTIARGAQGGCLVEVTVPSAFLDLSVSFDAESVSESVTVGLDTADLDAMVVAKQAGRGAPSPLGYVAGEGEVQVGLDGDTSVVDTLDFDEGAQTPSTVVGGTSEKSRAVLQVPYTSDGPKVDTLQLDSARLDADVLASRKRGGGTSRQRGVIGVDNPMPVVADTANFEALTKEAVADALAIVEKGVKG